MSRIVPRRGGRDSATPKEGGHAWLDDVEEGFEDGFFCEALADAPAAFGADVFELRVK